VPWSEGATARADIDHVAAVPWDYLTSPRRAAVVVEEEGRHGMNEGPSPPPASWHTDPLAGAPCLRWWAGNHWTGWIVASPVAPPSIAWRPEVGDLPSPICWGLAALRVASAPALRIEPRPVDVSHAPPVPVAAETAATPDVRSRPRRRARRVFMVAAAVVIVVCLVAVASVALLNGTASGARPTRHHALGSTAVRSAVGPGWW
jgi:hypothetical protein